MSTTLPLFRIVTVVTSISLPLLEVFFYGGGGPPVRGQALPAGVDAPPPRALSSFLAVAPGLRDVSAGTGTVFHVDNLEYLTNVSSLLGTSLQFRRIGPGVAALLMIPVEHQLVRFILLDKMTGPPREYINFNRAI